MGFAVNRKSDLALVAVAVATFCNSIFPTQRGAVELKPAEFQEVVARL